MEGGGDVCWNHFVCPRVHSVSPELLNRFFKPNLMWWCIIVSLCVLRKNWFTIFNVKVTARAYVIALM